MNTTAALTKQQPLAAAPTQPIDRKAPAKVNGPTEAIIRGATLATQIDDLLQLRTLLKQSQAAERELSGQILAALKAEGLDRFDGQRGIAIVGDRTVLTPDPAAFYRAVGRQAFAAMRVSVEAARELLGEQALQKISDATTTPTLRVIEKAVAA